MDRGESLVLAPLVGLQRCGPRCWRPGPTRSGGPRAPSSFPALREAQAGGPPDWISRSGLIGYPLLPARRLLLDISLDG